jgi:Glycine-zipper domain
MIGRKTWCAVLAAVVLLAGCAASVPTGPSVMVLPGNGKDFEQFKIDDAVCRQWALQQTGTTPAQAANKAAVSGAAVGTVVGAATGAAVGAAGGDAATGAAVGSGIGLLGGTAAGAGSAAQAQWSVQQRYDIAYMQCMYSKGNQIPVPEGFQQPPSAWGNPGTAPVRPPAGVPPPPPGNPPPPPPGPAW